MRRAASTSKKEGDSAVAQPKTGNELEQIAMAYDSRSNIPRDSIAYRMVASLGFDPLLILALTVIVVPGMFWLAGLAEAYSKQTFYTFPRSGTEYLALRIFEEKVIAAPFVRDPCKYSEEFAVVPMTEVVGLKPIQIKCLRRQFVSPKPAQIFTP